MYDVLIIGAGPAGISASLYAKRANLNVLVLFHGESQLEKANLIENYYGFENAVSGSDLYNAGINQAKNLGVEVIDAEVTNITFETAQSYTVCTPEKNYETKALIIASGNKKLRPAINGIKEFEGKGVSYCAVCDGFFYRQKNVCVIGSRRYALEEATHLSHIASSVTILTDGNDCDDIKNLAGEKIKIEQRKIKSVEGSAAVEKVVFEDGSNLPFDGVFVALGSAGGADFAKKLGLNLKGDSIAADEKMQTNARGIFSCGNVNGGLLQVCKAVYEGGVAGLSAVEYVRSLK